MVHPTVCRVWTEPHARSPQSNIDERLLAAARADNEDLLLEILEDPDSFDINYQDGFVCLFVTVFRSSLRSLHSKTWQYRYLNPAPEPKPS